jgi:hypothetical protein
MSGDTVPATVSPDEELLERALTAWTLMHANGVDLEAFILSLAGAEPYCLVSNFERKLREALAE